MFTTATEPERREDEVGADSWLWVAFNESPVGVALLDSRGRFLKLNPALLNLFGVPEQELTGRYVEAMAHPGDAAADGRHLRALLDGEYSFYQSEKRYHTSAGATRWCRVTLADVQRPGAGDRQFVAQFVDITAAKEAASRRRETDAQLEALFRHAPVVLSMRALDGRFMDANERLAGFLGSTRDDVRGRHITEFTNSPAATDLADDDARVWETRESVTRELVIPRPEGERVFHMVRFPVLDEHAEVEAIGSIGLEVTELRMAERKHQDVQERFRRAFEDAPVGMSVTTIDGRFVQVNEALATMLGYSPEAMLELTVADVHHPEDLERRQALLPSLLTGETDRIEVDDRLRRSDGSWIWVSRHTSSLRDEHGRTTRLLSHIVDLTARRRLEDELRHLADHDPLTGLLNRRGMEALLDRQIAHNRRYGTTGALLVLDLDNFKTVNDTFGHDQGDRVLIAVAELLTERLRGSDAIGRLGGDEFAVLLPECDAHTATSVAEKLCAALASAPKLSAAAGQLPISASIGVCALGLGVETTRLALRTADLAMYLAKQAGRGRVVVQEPEKLTA